MASLIPGYEYDIFISYRQKDNKHDGWVTEFVDNLTGELESTFKEEISVYFDINPHDGLLETHDVDASLKNKLKCLIFIPIISRTYCDPRSFAWEHEFKSFIELASKDSFGLKVKLANGNIANRVLPVRIYALDQEDIKLCESAIGGYLRGVEFIYKSAGVNRPLRFLEEKPYDNLNKTIYRDQINKVSNAINDIISGLTKGQNINLSERKFIENKQEKTGPTKQIKLPELKLKISRKQPKPLLTFTLWFIGLFILAASGYIGIRWYKSEQKIIWAKQVQIPAIQKIITENLSAPPTKAFEIATEIEKIIPSDSILINLWPKISCKLMLESEPSGANFFWKNYNEPLSDWNYIGTTPMLNVRFPSGHFRLKIERSGFETLLMAGFLWPSDSLYKVKLKLDSVGSLPEKMIRIPSQTTPMLIIGLEKYKGKRVGEFFADKYEVTNKDYKKFIDSGGYTNLSFWKYPFYQDGKELPWSEAVKLFKDKTGRLGPSTWEVGTFPDGTDDYPVAGISWYEASAYAEFAHKKLPTVYHWSIMADTWVAKDILPLSNFNGISTVPVGSMAGISSRGLYDIAGNVREWCRNEGSASDQHYILGGGYNDPSYVFNCAGTQQSLDRSISNGFRCIKEIFGDSTNNQTGKLELAYRDYTKEKPVDDKTFSIYLKQFAYDKSPLNAKIITIDDTGIYKIEKVTLDAAYNGEQFDIWLFLPRDSHPPYQPIILFPGSAVIQGGKFISTYKSTAYDVSWMDFIVRSGRVLVCPLLKGTYERSDALSSDLENESVFYKDHVIMWRKDLGRTIDYLETREDLLSDKIGYFGISWGGFLGGIMPAVETRIKAVALMVGGMPMERSLPEVDQINFLPRVHQPILMMNGIYDMFFPVETSQKPMLKMLGSKIKELKTYNEGHLVPRQELIKETLNWYDKYLGQVKK
jgi:eukaryotic-like serine/threonine-protein kinase